MASPAAPLTLAPLPELTLRIGIAGRRRLPNPDLICKSIQTILSTLEQWFQGSPYNLDVFSELADGTDRIAARCILERAAKPGVVHPSKNPPARCALTAILPMPPEVYCHTFFGQENSPYDSPCTPANPSVKEFQQFLSTAAAITVAPPPRDALPASPSELYSIPGRREEAYRWAGEYIVDNCELLLVVWDGKKDSRKGSAYWVYRYAQRSARSIVRIDASTGAIHWELGHEDLTAHIHRHQSLSREVRAVRPEAAEVKRRYDALVKTADNVHLSTEYFSQLEQFVLPLLVRARDLATHYQNLYNRAGVIGYSCAAAAACVAAVLSYTKSWHVFYFFEAVLIVVAFFSGLLLKLGGWQARWIDYRYLAERLRATCYLHIAGSPIEPAPEHPDRWLPAGWVTLALLGVWAQLKPVPPQAFEDPKQVRALAEFLYRSWIRSQQEYYWSAHEKNEKLNTFGELVSLALLIFSFVIAFAYGLAAIWPPLAEFLEPLGESPHVFATILPAMIGAIAGIMVFRHYARNSERYLSMYSFLKRAGTDVLSAVGIPNNEDHAPDLKALREKIIYADAAMAHEHEGWRTVFGVRLPGPG